MSIMRAVTYHAPLHPMDDFSGPENLTCAYCERVCPENGVAAWAPVADLPQQPHEPGRPYQHDDDRLQDVCIHVVDLLT